MKQYTVAVFFKEEWLKAYQWSNERVAEGYDFIATTYTPTATVKIATKRALTVIEQAGLTAKALKGKSPDLSLTGQAA